MTLIYNAVFDKNTRKLSFEDRTGNEIYSCTVPERAPAVDDITKPLTFKATQDGSTVQLTWSGGPSGSFYYSKNGGIWYEVGSFTKITLNIGDEVAFRARANRTKAQNFSNYFYFRMTGKIEAWHNVMSLYRKDDFATYNTVVECAFCNLFGGCQSLTKAPILPATTLAAYCYYYMFGGCQSLTKVPILPATTLAEGCYVNMFGGCGSLNEVHCQMPSTISAEDIPKYTAIRDGSSYPWLSNVSSTGTFYTNVDAKWPSGASGIPEGWQRINEIAKDDLSKPFTFRSTQDGSTVKLTKKGSPDGSFQTSRDGGSTWSDYTIGTVITLNTCDEVSFRVKTTRTSAQTNTAYFYFEMTGKIEAWHNVMSLYRKDDFATYNSVGTYDFYSLFYGCTSLTKAPVLSATRLAQNCYADMFFRCQSLTKAPALPATTLARGCYSSMFSGCQSLKEVRVSATKTATGALEEWLKDVSATGDFYCDPNVTIFPTGASGIPEGWKRIPPLDDITKPLTFKSTQDGSTVSLKKNGSPDGSFQTSRDGGSTWADYTLNTTITLNTGDEVAFRAKYDRTSTQDYDNQFKFKMTGKIEAWHNVMSLYRTNDFATYKSVVDHAFDGLFMNCTSLTKAPVLPATTLAELCYYYMFKGCQSLAEAPELPATALKQYCYGYMFSECQSLKEVRISATTTAYNALYNWLSGVSATGDFYCDPNVNFSTGASGIPENWNRRNIADYPN